MGTKDVECLGTKDPFAVLSTLNKIIGKYSHYQVNVWCESKEESQNLFNGIMASKTSQLSHQDFVDTYLRSCKIQLFLNFDAPHYNQQYQMIEGKGFCGVLCFFACNRWRKPNTISFQEY